MRRESKSQGLFLLGEEGRVPKRVREDVGPYGSGTRGDRVGEVGDESRGVGPVTGREGV